MLIKYDSVIIPYSSKTIDCVLEICSKGFNYKQDDYTTTFLVKDRILFFGLEELSSGKRTRFPGIQGFIPPAVYEDVLTHLYNSTSEGSLRVSNMIFTCCYDGIEIQFLDSFPIGWTYKDLNVSSLRRCFISKTAIEGFTVCGSTFDINASFSNGALRLPPMATAECEKLYAYLKMHMLS